MRILIDECIDERFRNSLPGHDCQTARYAGLAGLKNGDLLTAAEIAKFDVFLTVDQGFEYQQNLTASKLAIINFPCEVQPSARSLAPRACLPHAHGIYSTWPGRHNRGLGHRPPHPLSFRAKQADFFPRFAPARFLRSGWFCGTKRSACAVEESAFSSRFAPFYFPPSRF